MVDVIDILLVEQNDSHFELFSESLEDLPVDLRLLRVLEEKRLMDLLENSESSRLPNFKPRIIFFGLPLTPGGGWAFLEKRSQLARLRKIPLVVLSDTSITPEDRERVYDLGGNSFIVKPDSSAGYFDLVEVMRRYWFGIVMLPSCE